MFGKRKYPLICDKMSPLNKPSFILALTKKLRVFWGRFGRPRRPAACNKVANIWIHEPSRTDKKVAHVFFFLLRYVEKKMKDVVDWSKVKWSDGQTTDHEWPRISWGFRGTWGGGERRISWWAGSGGVMSMIPEESFSSLELLYFGEKGGKGRRKTYSVHCCPEKRKARKPTWCPKLTIREDMFPNFLSNANEPIYESSLLKSAFLKRRKIAHFDFIFFDIYWN